MDQRPLANADVTLTPTELKDKEGNPVPEAFGKTDGQGNYTLKVLPRGRGEPIVGAVTGAYRVRISIFDRTGKGQLVPEAYNRNTLLSFTVPADGSKEANFELSSNPSAPPVRTRPGGR
jgi:hypothetical protein